MHRDILKGDMLISCRDPKNVTDDEYNQFYTAFFKDSEKPLAWHHFSGDAGSGTAFKAIVFFPSKLWVLSSNCPFLFS